MVRALRSRLGNAERQVEHISQISSMNCPRKTLIKSHVNSTSKAFDSSSAPVRRACLCKLDHQTVHEDVLDGETDSQTEIWAGVRIPSQEASDPPRSGGREYYVRATTGIEGG
jgi:hypothetical protein